MKSSSRFKLADDIRHRRVLDEAVIVKQDNNEVMVVNDVSAAILEFIEEQKTVTAATLQAYLATVYQVEAAVLKKDIEKHLAELQTAGVIVGME